MDMKMSYSLWLRSKHKLRNAYIPSLTVWCQLKFIYYLEFVIIDMILCHFLTLILQSCGSGGGDGDGGWSFYGLMLREACYVVNSNPLCLFFPVSDGLSVVLSVCLSVSFYASLYLSLCPSLSLSPLSLNTWATQQYFYFNCSYLLNLILFSFRDWWPCRKMQFYIVVYDALLIFNVVALISFMQIRFEKPFLKLNIKSNFGEFIMPK